MVPDDVARREVDVVLTRLEAGNQAYAVDVRAGAPNRLRLVRAWKKTGTSELEQIETQFAACEQFQNALTTLRHTIRPSLTWLMNSNLNAN